MAAHPDCSFAGWMRRTLLLAVIAALTTSSCAAGAEDRTTIDQPEQAVQSVAASSTLAITTTSDSIRNANESVASSIRDDARSIVKDIVPLDGDSFVEGSVEYFEWVRQCGGLLGVDLTVGVSPPALFPTSENSTQRDGQVVEACLAVAEEQPWFVGYPFDGSAEANRLQYQFELEIYECLRANGYPTVDPPSEDAYVSGEADWGAYAAMGRGVPLYVNPNMDPPPGSAEQLEAQQLCGASLAAIYQDHVLNASS